MVVDQSCTKCLGGTFCLRLFARFNSRRARTERCRLLSTTIITDSCGVEPTERNDRRDKPNAVQVSKRASEPGAGVGPDRDKQMKSRRYRRETQSRDDRPGSWSVTMPKTQSPMIPMRPMNCESPSLSMARCEAWENSARTRRELGASRSRTFMKTVSTQRELGASPAWDSREPFWNIREDRLWRSV